MEGGAGIPRNTVIGRMFEIPTLVEFATEVRKKNPNLGI